MPKNITKTKLKTVLGYKVCLENNGNLYSMSTGIEYKIGQIKAVTNIPLTHQVGRQKMVNPKNFMNKYYTDKMKGLTCVFVNYDDAENYRQYVAKRGVQLAMVASFTLHGCIYKAKSDDGEDLYMGNKIQNIQYNSIFVRTY